MSVPNGKALTETTMLRLAFYAKFEDYFWQMYAPKCNNCFYVSFI